ncbi:hypothetical protein F4819DRAFT_492270 [Hypoxylon fuscum]|nr:hypothetical protein F4819DRAFT_492270 [Hypoxylon fuscum]
MAHGIARASTLDVLPFLARLPQALRRISLESLVEQDPAAESDLWEACRIPEYAEQQQDVAVARYRSLFGYNVAGIVVQHKPHKRHGRGDSGT